MLKAKYFAAPAVALIAVVAWNIHQHRSLKNVEEENADWEQRIDETRSGPTRTRAQERNGSEVSRTHPILKGSGGPVDWQAAAQRIVEMDDSADAADVQAMVEFQDRVQSMSDRELVAAIEEVEALGLDEDALELMQEILVEPLIEKNPELALETFSDRIEDDPDGIGWQLSFAMSEWAISDAKGAQEWLDRQIAAGLFDSKTLDGRSEVRLEFEAALVGELLGQDPAAAERRIAALLEDERRETLEQVSFTDLNETGQRTYAELIRGLVPEDERAGSFAYLVEDIVPDGGYPAVDTFFDRVNATPAERAVAARQAAGSRIEEIADERTVTGADIEEMRGWLSGHDPVSVDKLTGRAIADATQDCSEFPFEDAERLAREYFRKSGNDEVIVAFLESFAARSNLEEAMPLAELIANPERREEVLQRLK